MTIDEHNQKQQRFQVLVISARRLPPEPADYPLEVTRWRDPDAVNIDRLDQLDFGIALVLLDAKYLAKRKSVDDLPKIFGSDSLAEWEYVILGRGRGKNAPLWLNPEASEERFEADPGVGFWHLVKWLAAGALLRRYGFVVGVGNAMWKVCSHLEASAGELTERFRLSTLVLGESGVGKERLVETIHHLSSRRSAALVRFNCAAVPRDLVASELFGVRKGAYTSAVRDTRGLALEADGGTLFLDEVVELPLEAQGTLLRFYDDGVIQPVGASGRDIEVDVKLIAATNKNPEQLSEDGRFRFDLLQRLAGIVIEIPSLRQRGKDDEDDMAYFVEHFLMEIGVQPPREGMDRYARFLAIQKELENRSSVVKQYDWPGNVRELRFAIQRCAVLGRSDRWDVFWSQLRDFASTSIRRAEHRAGPGDQREASAPGLSDFTDLDLDLDLDRTYDEIIADLTRHLFTAALEETGGNTTKAIEHLGLSRSRYYDLRKRYKVE